MQQVIGEPAWLGQGIESTENLKLNRSILNQLREIIFLNEILVNFQEFYTHILSSIYW